jgi:hypothetical protein
VAALDGGNIEDEVLRYGIRILNIVPPIWRQPMECGSLACYRFGSPLLLLASSHHGRIMVRYLIFSP